MRKNSAYFVEHPKRIEELEFMRNTGTESLFSIVKTIKLKTCDYRNFTCDMLVWREFLEKNAALCEGGGMEGINCLFITTSWIKCGVLVVPNKSGHVVSAAYHVPERNGQR